MKIIKLTIFICAFLFLTNDVQAANSPGFSVSISLKASSSVANKAIIAKAEELRMVTNASGYPVCQINSSATWQTAVVSNKVLSAGTWSRISCTYNEKYLKIFIDGEETGSQALTVTIDDTAASLKIGQDDSSGSSYTNLTGLVDDFKFYPYALNEEEIKKDYNSGKTAVFGGGSTESDGLTKTSAKSREYCVPGDTATCDPPVLELKMDKKSGSTAYDTSGNDNDGTIFGATHSQGKLGAGLSFDGHDDYVDVGDISNNLKSISFWLKAYSSNEPLFDLNGGTNTITISSGLINANNFSAPDIYINGQLGSSIDLNWNFVTINTATNISVSDLDIGKIATNYFSGKIDDVRIYDYARTPAQIAWDYNHGKPIAEYRFDECSGSIIHDESGNGNHGTLNLGTSGVTATGTCASSSNSFWSNGADGKKNGSGSFDGGDDVVVAANIDEMDNMDQFTICAWINPLEADSSYPFLVDKSENGHDGWNFYMSSEERLGLSIGRNEGDYFERESNNSVLNNGSWQHVCGSYGGALVSSDVNLFLNGNIITEFAHTGYSGGTREDDSAKPICIGNNIAGSYHYEGQIDEVKIWNYALTAEQIKSEYNGGVVKFGQ